MKRNMLSGVSCLIVILMLSLSGCTNKEKLYLMNWDEYMDPVLIEMFESEYNCDVVLETQLSNESMYSRISTKMAPYDIAIPSDYMIDQMKANKLIQEIDFTRLENYSADMFDDTLQSLIDNDPCVNYKNYTIPYFWGSLGIMYNTDNLSNTEQQIIIDNGWDVLFDKELLPNKKVGMYESSRDAIAAAELYLGYSLNTTDIDELNNVKQALAAFNYTMWGTDDLKTSVVNGNLDYAIVYSGDYFDMVYSKLEENEENNSFNFKMYTPKASNNIFFDGMVIPTTSQNTELAYKFIDFMLKYENSLANAQYVGYCPTIKAVYEAMISDEELYDVVTQDAYYPGDINGEVYKYMGKEIYDKFDEIFVAVKK